MKKNLITQLIYRVVMCCVSALATLLSVRFFHNVYKHTPEFEFVSGLSDLNWEFLKYYTNISNWFVFAVSVVVCAATVKKVRSGEREGTVTVISALKFVTTVMITITFIGYNFMIDNPFTIRYWRNLYSLICHVVAPVMFVLDYFLFDAHRQIKVYYPLVAMVFPTVYAAAILVVGACVKDFKYPYFFLDVNRYGYGGVMLWILLFVAIFAIVGYLYWLYDKLVIVDGKRKLDFSPLTPKAVSESAGAGAVRDLAAPVSDSGEDEEE